MTPLVGVAQLEKLSYTGPVFRGCLLAPPLAPVLTGRGFFFGVLFQQPDQRVARLSAEIITDQKITLQCKMNTEWYKFHLHHIFGVRC